MFNLPNLPDSIAGEAYATLCGALPEHEQYALLYPERAARIRAERGLPARLDFGPPAPEVVEALVNGSSPILRALDQQPGRSVSLPATRSRRGGQ